MPVSKKRKLHYTGLTPKQVLVFSHHDPRPIRKWTIPVDRHPHCSFQEFQTHLEKDDIFQAWLSHGLECHIPFDARYADRSDGNPSLAVFTTFDPEVANAIADNCNIHWIRNQIDYSDTPVAKGLMAMNPANFTIHLVVSDLWTGPQGISALIGKVKDPLEKDKDFEWMCDDIGPIPRYEEDWYRFQTWFCSGERPDESELEKKLTAHIDTPFLFNVSETNKHDFCSRARYQGHPGYRRPGEYYRSGGGPGLYPNYPSDETTSRIDQSFYVKLNKEPDLVNPRA